MTTGDIVIIAFPYTDLVSFKARPAVVVNNVRDNFNDVIVCLITSVVSGSTGKFEILLNADSTNNLKTNSLIKVARLATVEQSKIKAVIGKLNPNQLKEFTSIFKSLIDPT